MASNCPTWTSSKTSNSMAATDIGTSTCTFGTLPNTSTGPWQIFKLTGRRRSRESLPEAPSGMEWVQNEITYEWRLVKSTESTTKTTVVTNTNTLHPHSVEIVEHGRKSFSTNTSQRTEECASVSAASSNQHVDPNDTENSQAKFLITAATEQATATGKHGLREPMCAFKEPEATIISSLAERVLRLVSPERPISVCHLETTTSLPNTSNGNDSCISKTKESESDEFVSNNLKMPNLSMDFPELLPQQKAIGYSHIGKLDPPVLNIQGYCDGSNAHPTLHPKSSISTRTAITNRSFSSSPSNANKVIIDDVPDNFLESLNRYQDITCNDEKYNTKRSANHYLARKNDDEWEVLSSDRLETDSFQSGADVYSYSSISSQVKQQGSIHGSNPWNSAVTNNIAPHGCCIHRHVNSLQQTRRMTTTSGSVRSIDEADDDSWHVETIETCDCIDVSSKEQKSKRSIPYKIQRTNSNSTIDSSDVNGGGGSSCFSSKKELLSTTSNSATLAGDKSNGIVGVDFVYHIVLPTDTLQGICLAYKISSTRLRQANHFSGCSLLLAPKKLVVPISKQALRQGYIRIQDTDTAEYKIHAFLAEFNDYDRAEAKSYLELSEWCLQDAIRSAREDGEWEHDDISNSSAFNKVVRIDTTQTSNTGTSSTAHNFITTMPFQQKLAILNPVTSAAATAAAAAATAVFKLSSSASPMSKSIRSKMSPVCQMPQNVPHTLQDKNDDSDSFFACDEGSATSSKSTNTFEYVMNDINDIGSINQSDIETHALVQRKNEVRTSTSTTGPMKLHDIPGAIATKSVHVQDMYKATSQHNNFGVELKSLSLSSSLSTVSNLEK